MKLSLTRAMILSIIKEKEPISVTDLAEEVGISTGSTIHRYIKELKQRGFITVHQEKNKVGRPTMVSTTGKGEPLSKGERELFKQMLDLKNKLKETFNKK